MTFLKQTNDGLIAGWCSQTHYSQLQQQIVSLSKSPGVVSNRLQVSSSHPVISQLCFTSCLPLVTQLSRVCLAGGLAIVSQFVPDAVSRMFPNLNSACPPHSPVVSQMWSPNSFPIAFHLFPSCLLDHLSQLWSSIIYLNYQSLLLLVCKAGLMNCPSKMLNTNLPKLHLGKKDVWWCLMMFDDVWWCLMMFDDVWWCLMMFDIHIVMNMWRSYCWSNLISAQMMSRTSGWSCSCFTRLMTGRKRQPQSTPPVRGNPRNPIYGGLTRSTHSHVVFNSFAHLALEDISPFYTQTHVCLPFFSNNAESGC